MDERVPEFAHFMRIILPSSRHIAPSPNAIEQVARTGRRIAIRRAPIATKASFEFRKETNQIGTLQLGLRGVEVL